MYLGNFVSNISTPTHSTNKFPSPQEMNTQLDIEGSTLSWQAGRIQREIDGYQARYDRQVAKNATGARGERTNQYHKPQVRER